MKPIQGYHLVKPEDLLWRVSNLMKIPNADYLERTGGTRVPSWCNDQAGSVALLSGRSETVAPGTGRRGMAAKDLIATVMGAGGEE